jgi:hypothetical protein
LAVHYVRLAVDPRHIRDSPFLRDLDLHHPNRGVWNSLRISEVRNRKALRPECMFRPAV